MTAWSQDAIREALDLRASRGSAFVTLRSPREARTFRSAIYNYARRRGINGFTARVSGCDLILETKSDLRRPSEIRET